ncbi:hypothetical protein H5410_003740 [Solanum commersonii]|uniref:Uncharacterized protein n=1 Tax=Solanum commersonii TaxID=4109 RepID=A0A9J6B6H5_SOLCO|nr:hypothetical protein H5410_003740 [Solanum commersonii]
MIDSYLTLGSDCLDGGAAVLLIMFFPPSSKEKREEWECWPPTHWSSSLLTEIAMFLPVLAGRNRIRREEGDWLCLFCGEEVVRWLHDGVVGRQNRGSNYWLGSDGEEKKSSNFWEIFIF